MKSISLWDLPTRLFHWLLVLAVTGSLVTVSLGGTWMLWHERFGLTIVGLISFRLVWGIVGSTYARFLQFVPGPSAISAYLKGEWQGVGHNPLGALSVLAMLGLLGVQAVTGLFASDAIAFNGPLTRTVSSSTVSTLSSLHRQTELWLYILLGLHVLAVIVHQLRGKRLIGSMIHGWTALAESEAAPRTRSPLKTALTVVLALRSEERRVGKE